MQFFSSAITTLQTLVVALGAGLGVRGVVNLLEGYGPDNVSALREKLRRADIVLYYLSCSDVFFFKIRGTFVR